MTHFSLPQYLKLSKNQEAPISSQTPKHYGLSIVRGKFLGSCPSCLVAKESASEFGYLASLPRQLGKNESEREEEALTTHRKCHCQKGRRWGSERGGIKTTHSKPQQVCNHLVKANCPFKRP